jgi:hypothetical protein
MIRIPLSQGKYALIDDEDAHLASESRWFATRRATATYAFRNVRRPGQKPTIELLHRAIMRAAPGTQVDHINRDGLDNRRENLRLTTPSLNQANSRKRASSASPWKGARYRGPSRGWQARIRVHGKDIHLGRFASGVEAAVAYDAAALRYFGEHARLNLPRAE